MAFKKTYTFPFGASGEYWTITEAHSVKTIGGMRYSVAMTLYKDEQSYKVGGIPAMPMSIGQTINGVLDTAGEESIGWRKWCYQQLKAGEYQECGEMNYWEDAEDLV